MNEQYDLGLKYRVRVFWAIATVSPHMQGSAIVCTPSAVVERVEEVSWLDFVVETVLWVAGTNEHKKEFMDKLLSEGSAAVAMTGGMVVVAVLLRSEGE